MPIVHVLLQFEHVIKTALAKVYIDSPYFVGEVIVWCLQNRFYDVIIGNVEGAIDPNDPSNCSFCLSSRALSCSAFM
jgi:hypothetical protein